VEVVPGWKGRRVNRLSLSLLIAHVCLTGAGAGSFTNISEESGAAEVVRSHHANVPKWWLSGMDLIDIDGDGDLDLHLGGHGSPAAAALNDGKGRFTCVDPKLAIPRGVRHGDPLPYPGGEVRLAYDFDEDGSTDILASWHDGGGVLYRNGSQPGEWTFSRPRTLDQFNRACAMADMDRDGRVDYLADAGGRTNPQVLILFGEGDGNFERKRQIPGALQESCPIPVDIDGDGDLDFLLSQRGYSAPGRRILLNDGKLGFTNVTEEAGLTEDGGSIHGAGDVDQDGDADLICVEGSDLVIYLNDGRGNFAKKPDAVRGMEKMPASARPRNTNWGGAVVTDFDNDGRADIIVNGRYFLHVLRGTGGGQFTAVTHAWGLPTSAWSAVDEGLCFGDIDGDGDLDLVTCGPGPTPKQKGVALWRNDLPPRNWVRVRLVGARGNRGAAGAKIRIYEAGGLGDRGRLIGYEQIAVWGRQSFHNYYAATDTERHFGLGERGAVDLSVEFYPSGKRQVQRGVQAKATVMIREQ
jgi:hypothetical protein